ncbi:MAG: 30S ribosomal protein S4 [Bacilli bacterium]
MRYTGPAFKKSRRVGFSTLENGKDIARKPYSPGQHGQRRRGKISEYGLQLKEKQKIRFTYGINERQFRNTFEKAKKLHGVLGEDFLKLLESRLDNIVYRAGIARTRRAARQLVNHGHILVNGKKVDIPSYQLKPGDIINIKEASLDHPAIKVALADVNSRPEYISFDDNKLEVKYLRYPQRTEITSEINEDLVVEFYNR